MYGPFVWDWNTGDLVLDIAGGSELLGDETGIIFLDEFQVMVSTPDNTGNAPRFSVFNTLVPQNNSRNPRHFLVPSKYRTWFPYMNASHSTPSGTLDRDGPLIIDPTQAVLAVELFSREEPWAIFLVVLRTQALIEHACSVSTDTDIPWDEWGSKVMNIEIPADGDNAHVIVQGVHVIVVKHDAVPGDGVRKCLRLRIFDFNRQGYGALREGCAAGPTAWYEGGRDVFLEGSEYVTEDELCSLGDGSFFYLERYPVSGALLHVWELV